MQERVNVGKRERETERERDAREGETSRPYDLIKPSHCLHFFSISINRRNPIRRKSNVPRRGTADVTLRRGGVH